LPACGRDWGRLEAGTRTAAAQGRTRRGRGGIAVRARYGCAWCPPFPIDRHLDPARRRRWLPTIGRAGGPVGSNWRGGGWLRPVH